MHAIMNEQRDAVDWLLEYRSSGMVDQEIAREVREGNCIRPDPKGGRERRSLGSPHHFDRDGSSPRGTFSGCAWPVARPAYACHTYPAL